jgi:RNA polymerase sigma factor (sigma-70 family)
VSDKDWLAERFEENRGHLRAVAYRMLGSASEADDAVQESWLRLSRSDAGEIENLGGWLTTVVARVCLDMLRSRTARREEALEKSEGAAPAMPAHRLTRDPERETLLADSVGFALLLVLDRLDPAERLAFVMHDMFDVPFEEIARIVGRSPEAARQLASRARRRVHGGGEVSVATRSQQRRVVEAFLAALQVGDFEGLLKVLDPEVVVRVDAAAARADAPKEIRGAANWARGAIAFSRAISQTAGSVAPMLVDGRPGLVLAPDGQPQRALLFTIEAGKIAGVEIIGDPARLQQLDLAILDA